MYIWMDILIKAKEKIRTSLCLYLYIKQISTDQLACPLNLNIHM